MTTNDLVGGIFLLVGLLAVTFGLKQAQKARWASQTWSTAEGEILESFVQKHIIYGKKGESTYSPVVSYRYTVNGQVYTGYKFGFGSCDFSETTAYDKIAPYPAGAKTTIHYDPADPAKAVLETIATNVGSALGFGVFLIIVGIVAIK